MNVKRTIEQLRTAAIKASPKPREITLDRVRSVLEHAAESDNGTYYSIAMIVDMLNGLASKDCFRPSDGHEYAEWTKRVAKIRKKLQQAPGTTSHETVTSGQSSAVRKQLTKLEATGQIDKQRGGGNSNNSFSYRWATQERRAAEGIEARRVAALHAYANSLARQLSLACGGRGDQGVKPQVWPNARGKESPISIQLTMSGATALKVLSALRQHGQGPLPEAPFEIARHVSSEAHQRGEALKAWEDEKFSVREWKGRFWADCEGYTNVDYEVAHTYYLQITHGQVMHTTWWADTPYYGIFPAKSIMVLNINNPLG